jgi:uncharacterized protein YheU (UPF0270 family)
MPTKIPYQQLSPEALEGVIEQFVSRDGLDSGNVNISFDKKVTQVKQRLKSGKAFILYDEELQSCNIISKDDPSYKNHKLK